MRVRRDFVMTNQSWRWETRRVGKSFPFPKIRPDRRRYNVRSYVRTYVPTYIRIPPMIRRAALFVATNKTFFVATIPSGTYNFSMFVQNADEYVFSYRKLFTTRTVISNMNHWNIIKRRLPRELLLRNSRRATIRPGRIVRTDWRRTFKRIYNFVYVRRSPLREYIWASL